MGRYITQTELANEFFISSVLMGKKLVKMGLRDPETKMATEKSIKDGIAKNVSIKETIFSKWDKSLIKKIEKTINQDEEFCIDVIVGFLVTMNKVSESYDGSKMDDILSDSLYMRFEDIYRKIKIFGNIKDQILKKCKNKGVEEGFSYYINNIEDN